MKITNGIMIVGFLVSFAFAQSSPSRNQRMEVSKDRIAEGITEEDAWAAEYFSQFGEGYVPPMSVQEHIDLSGLVDTILFDGWLEGRQITVLWSSNNHNKLSILVNGERLHDLRVQNLRGQNLEDRITWNAEFIKVKGNRRNSQMESNFSGWIVAGDDSLILQIQVIDSIYRIDTILINTTDGGGVAAHGNVSSSSNCVCYGRPPKGSCTAAKCDTADGCAKKGGGDPNSTCSWRYLN